MKYLYKWKKIRNWGDFGLSKKSNLKANLIYNVAYQILLIILPFITSPYVSRVLGADNVGIFSTSNAYAHYFFLFAMLGVNNYGNRAIARVRDDKNLLGKTFWEIFSFQFITSVIICAVYIPSVLLRNMDNKTIYIIQFMYVLSAAFDINWCCFGLEKFKLSTTRSTIIRVLMAIAVFVFVKDQSDLPVYTAIIAGGGLLSMLAVWPFIMKNVPFVKPSFSGIISHIKPNIVLFLPVIATSIYNIMDKLMLGEMSTDAEVAFYTYSENITQIPCTLIIALNNVVMPRMSNLFAKGTDSKITNRLMDIIMMFAMLLSCAMSFGLAGVAEVFAPWFYGNDFSRCGMFTMLLCPVIIFKAWAGVLRTQYIIPKGKDKLYITSLTIGAIVNLVINFILIPKFEGIGAIVGTLAAEFSVAFVQFLLVRKEVPIMEYIKNGIVFCIIGAFMFAVIYNMRNIPLAAPFVILIQVITGGVIYMLIAAFYMIKIKKNPVLINEGLKMLHIKYRFK